MVRKGRVKEVAEGGARRRRRGKRRRLVRRRWRKVGGIVEGGKRKEGGGRRREEKEEGGEGRRRKEEGEKKGKGVFGVVLLLRVVGEQSKSEVVSWLSQTFFSAMTFSSARRNKGPPGPSFSALFWFFGFNFASFGPASCPPPQVSSTSVRKLNALLSPY